MNEPPWGTMLVITIGIAIVAFWVASQLVGGSGGLP